MPAPVTTFFEGEIVDNVHASFFTADWDACADTDFQHWSKFPPFRHIHAEVVRHGGRCPSEQGLGGEGRKGPATNAAWTSPCVLGLAFLTGGACAPCVAGLASHPYIYMRWKEQFFVRGSECRLTIAGFYYLALNRQAGWRGTGAIEAAAAPCRSGCAARFRHAPPHACQPAPPF
jgi:hypothetical protein